jgi:protein O-mannosyl-transferase
MKKNYQLLAVAVLMVLLVMVSYNKAFKNDFVDWDDYTYVVENDLVRNPQEKTIKDVFSSYVSSNYHPLTILSLRMNNNKCRTCPDGISPAPFIKWNVIIHILNTLLVFLLIYLLSNRSIFVSVFVAAIFGVHPMHVESVAWISERKDVLYSFFFLTGLLTYLKYLNINDHPKKKYPWLVITFMLFILACLSKAMAVVFPLVLVMIKFWTSQPATKYSLKESIKETFSLRILIPLIPFFVVSVIFGILAISVSTINSFTTLHRIQYASYGILMYIVKFFLPVNLAAVYPYPTLAEFNGTWGTLIKTAPFLLILVAGLVIYSARKTKLFVFGLGFFLITVIMVSQIISVGTAIMANRYVYLAYIGLAFIPAMLLEKYLRKRSHVYFISACFVVIMLILCRRQTEIWRNGETLWQSAITLYPDAETPRSLRGIYYSKKAKKTFNQKEKRLYETKAAIDFNAAIKAGTRKADIFEGLGCIYGSWGDYNNSLAALNRAIGLKPENGSAYFNRALTLEKMNREADAIKDYDLALRFSPEKSYEIINNRSNLLLSTGRIKEAIADFDYLISVNRQNFLYYYNRAVARLQTNDVPGAISDLKIAIQLKPDDEPGKILLEKILKNQKPL